MPTKTFYAVATYGGDRWPEIVSVTGTVRAKTVRFDRSVSGMGAAFGYRNTIPLDDPALHSTPDEAWDAYLADIDAKVQKCNDDLRRYAALAAAAKEARANGN